MNDKMREKWGVYRPDGTLVEIVDNQDDAMKVTNGLYVNGYSYRLIGHTSTKESILAEAERLINGVKRDDYGPVEESFERIAQGWSLIIGAPVTPEQVALCMVWLKVMRYCQSQTRDSAVDMAGYAGLLEKLQ